MLARMLAAALAAATLAPSLADGQQPTRRRQEAITIRGQVPTPQVVTVRPREVPTYQRNVLVPNFYDRDFWASILPAYLVVPERMVTGEAPLHAGADSAGMMDAAATPPGAAPLGAAVAPGDSAAATTVPPLPPRPSRPFMRTRGTPGSGTPAGAAPATPPSTVPPAGASGTAPALPPR